MSVLCVLFLTSSMRHLTSVHPQVGQVEERLSTVDQQGIHVVQYANRLITLTATLIIEVYGELVAMGL